MSERIIRKLLSVSAILLFAGNFLLKANSYIKSISDKSDKKDNNKKENEEIKQNNKFLKEAMFYEKLDDGKVICNLCPRNCVLSPGEIGFCRARQNLGGVLYTLNYGKVVAMHVDPVEKKPLFHFLPGSKAFSISCAGCNLRCKFCQNWEISQRSPKEVPFYYISPDKLVELALKSKSESIAFTYGEPVIYYEYMYDVAKIAHEKGLKTVMITAGYINEKPLKFLLKYIDAVKVDLKGFNNKFYLKYTTAKLNPVLDTIKTVKKSGVWLEIVNLVIPGVNDSKKDIEGLAKWVKENLGTDVPVHFTRFHPDYKMRDLPPTPVETLVRARKIAMDMGLKYVYTGNVNWPEGEITYCPESGKKAIIRRGFFVIENNLKNGKCSDGEKVAGVWN